MKPTLEYEALTGNRFVAGIDEVGRGAIAGPVVVGMILIDMQLKLPDFFTKNVKDSKLLSHKKRDIIYDHLIRHHHYSIGMASEKEIDRINILEATKLAIKRSIQIAPFKIDHILIDGNMNFDFLSHSYTNIIKGDIKCFSIAAASIIAKIYRDNMMNQIDKLYPAYDFKSHKGYGTKKHLEQIKQLGLTEYHRKSFKLSV